MFDSFPYVAGAMKRYLNSVRLRIIAALGGVDRRYADRMEANAARALAGNVRLQRIIKARADMCQYRGDLLAAAVVLIDQLRRENRQQATELVGMGVRPDGR